MSKVCNCDVYTQLPFTRVYQDVRRAYMICDRVSNKQNMIMEHDENQLRRCNNMCASIRTTYALQFNPHIRAHNMCASSVHFKPHVRFSPNPISRCINMCTNICVLVQLHIPVH